VAKNLVLAHCHLTVQGSGETTFVGGSTLPKKEDPEMLRRRSAEEILTTEQAYVEQLTMLITVLTNFYSLCLLLNLLMI